MKPWGDSHENLKIIFSQAQRKSRVEKMVQRKKTRVETRANKRMGRLTRRPRRPRGKEKAETRPTAFPGHNLARPYHGSEYGRTGIRQGLPTKKPCPSPRGNGRKRIAITNYFSSDFICYISSGRIRFTKTYIKELWINERRTKQLLTGRGEKNQTFERFFERQTCLTRASTAPWNQVRRTNQKPRHDDGV